MHGIVWSDREQETRGGAPPARKTGGFHPPPPSRCGPRKPRRFAHGFRRGVVASGLLLALLIACTACDKDTVKSPDDILAQHSGNFDTTANISYKNLVATATITQETPKSCSVTFTSPPSLANMAFIFREEAVDLSYKDLSFTFDPQSVPGRAVAAIAVSSINKAMKGDGISMDYTEGILTLTGVMESGEFRLCLDPDKGNLLKLSVPQEELEIEFVNFKFLD